MRPPGVAARTRATMASAALTEICCEMMASTSVSKMLGLGARVQGPTRAITDHVSPGGESGHVMFFLFVLACL